MTEYSVCIRFSGLTVRFRFPTSVRLPREFQALACPDTGSVDAEYEVRLLHRPLAPAGAPLMTDGRSTVYSTTQGQLRIYSPLTAEDGCQVACLLCPGGKNVLYYPASRWERYAEELHCMHLIWGERLLYYHNAFLLHSSVVQYEGKTVLFSGPSGAGKSTQANLWEQYLGAEILNGDRCVIMKKGDTFYGGGSPWSGTSGIYNPGQAPIAGILLVGQSEKNTLTSLGAAAFAPILTQTTLNSWDTAYMDSVISLVSELLSRVPVYRLDCRPDEEAVRLVRSTLFE